MLPAATCLKISDTTRTNLPANLRAFHCVCLLQLIDVLCSLMTWIQGPLTVHLLQKRWSLQVPSAGLHHCQAFPEDMAPPCDLHVRSRLALLAKRRPGGVPF